jgi:hypothetical protein
MTLRAEENAFLDKTIWITPVRMDPVQARNRRQWTPLTPGEVDRKCTG